MDIEEKIDSLIEFINDNNIKIIDNELIKGIIINAEVEFDKDGYAYNKLLDKGFTHDDIEDFEKFLEANDLILANYDDISGISFEGCEYSTDILHESDLWDKVEYVDIDERW